MSRQTKSPAERAQAAFDTAYRQLQRARTRRDQLATDLKAAETEVTAAEKRRDYLAMNPDLPPAQNIDTYGTTQSATVTT